MSEPPNKPRLDVLGGLLSSLAASGPPSLDGARDALGGAWVGDSDAALSVGDGVEIGAATAVRAGVVVHIGEGACDVWIGGGRIQRVPLADARAAAVDASLRRVASDALVHASLEVGCEVRFLRRDDSTEVGTLVEKLRYGSLVGTADGRVLAVSFRRIAPRDDAVTG